MSSTFRRRPGPWRGSPPRGKRSVACVAAGLASVTVAAGCGGSAGLPTAPHVQVLVTGSPAAIALPSPAATVPPAVSAAAVIGALKGPLSSAALGPAAHRYAYVVDVTSGAVLLNDHGAVPIPPASAIKLLTARAALRALGPATRLRTTVVATAKPDGTGTVRGNLWLVGAGDQTLTEASMPADPRTATVAELVTAVKAAGIRNVTGSVIGDGSLFTDTGLPIGWSQSYISGGSVAPLTALQVDGGRTEPDLEPAGRVEDPALTAALDLAHGLRAAGITVSGNTTTGKATAGAVAVAAVPGLPVGAIVRRMLTYSDDDLGEALARLVAIRLGLPGDADGAGTVLDQEAASLGAPSNVVESGGVIAHDGSGLSHADRVPLSVLTATLLKAPTDLLAGLPIAGHTGTLAERFRTGPSAVGNSLVRAKTGALLGINTLVGLARLRDGHLLAFGFGGDDVPSREAAEAALDACAAALTQL